MKGLFQQENVPEGATGCLPLEGCDWGTGPPPNPWPAMRPTEGQGPCLTEELGVKPRKVSCLAKPGDLRAWALGATHPGWAGPHGPLQQRRPGRPAPDEGAALRPLLSPCRALRSHPRCPC